MIARGAIAGLVRVALAVLLVAVIGWSLGEAAAGSPGERAARAAGLLPADDADIGATARAVLVAGQARRFGLDRPLPIRLASGVVGLARLDLGSSWRDGGDVAAAVGRAAPPTLVCAGLALAVAVAAGLALAVAAALRPGSGIDRAIAALAAVGLATPIAWLGLAAASALAAGRPLRLLPIDGWGRPLALVLPVMVLAVAPTMVIARHGRAALLAAVREPWAIAARARGLSERRLVGRHALAVALPNLCALLPSLCAYLLGASVVTERIFAVRGLGALLSDAAARGDQPVVVGVAIAAAACVSAVAGLADAAGSRLDPRGVAPG